MTAEFSEPTVPYLEIERINEEAAEAARRLTTEICQQTIDTIYAGVQVHLQVDLEATKALEYDTSQKPALSVYVLEDLLTAPRRDGQFVKTLSCELTPEAGEKISPSTTMRIHIPTGGLSLYEIESPEDVKKPDEVYIEFKQGKDSHWYAISKQGMFEYIPLAEQDDENNTVLSDDGIWQWVSDRIPETMETASSLMRDIVNWRTVPQRQINI